LVAMAAATTIAKTRSMKTWEHRRELPSLTGEMME